MQQYTNMSMFVYSMFGTKTLVPSVLPPVDKVRRW